MTAPQADTLERDDFVSDAEIARRWRVSVKTARAAIRVFERSPARGMAFPPREPALANRRAWRAINAYIDRRYGVTVPDLDDIPDGEENLHAKASDNRRRARPPMAPPR